METTQKLYHKNLFLKGDKISTLGNTVIILSHNIMFTNVRNPSSELVNNIYIALQLWLWCQLGRYIVVSMLHTQTPCKQVSPVPGKK